jgi:quinone-modifying oxidoreductase subunit QmoB
MMKAETGQITLALCTGCGIGDCMDADQLMHTVGKEHEGIHLFKHHALCSAEGVQHLNEVLKKQQTDRLALAACSPRAKTAIFDIPGILVERINLREQVAWVMEPGEEDTLMCAEDLTRMALAKLRAISENRPYFQENTVKSIAVIGGGVAGLTAALDGARAGYHVYLVEQRNVLGGYSGRIHKLLPQSADSGGLREPETGRMAGEAMNHPGVEVFLGSTVESISGEPGNFSISLQNGEHTRFSAGAVVVATGWSPYDPTKLNQLGYGSDRVKTLEEFEAHVQENEIPDRVLFVLCAGSRDEKHLPYCSAYCCSAALKQALYIREKNRNAEVYVIYRDIRTPGFQEAFYQMVQSDDAIFLTKGRVDRVVDDGSHVSVEVIDSLLGEEIQIHAEMVVLSTGMVPNTTSDLQLQYRLGEGLPELAYNFSDSHFICFPYETRRTGIYAAGTIRAPMDLEGAAEDGSGAMLKAIQAIEATSRGEAVHPRAGDRTVPELYMDRCTDCKRCTEECPFGSYDETEKGTPLPNPSRCRRCGICIGSCPERVIGFSDFSINSVSAMIKSVHVPDEFEEKPRILVFVCENDAYPALDMAGIHRLKYSSFARIIPVRCLGSINKVWISDALSHGYDGILQIGCKPGDDYQCHFIHGSMLTEERAENLQETLETMMLEPERIKTCFVEINGHHEITGIINEYVEEIGLLGPNPFKSL